MGKIILNSTNLIKSYQNGGKRLVVLNGVNIELETGTITTIVGESGSGKSTLLNVLSSLDTFDSGKLIIDNEDIMSFNEVNLSSFRNEKIGFIFQLHHLLPDFTVMDNVLMPLWIKNGTGHFERPRELLSNFGLLKIKDKYPAEISGGERQRVAIIRSIVNKPKILFADEPSGNLDEKNSTKLIDLFKRINRDYGTTIMLTTHNPSIAGVGNKVYELKSGILIKK